MVCFETDRLVLSSATEIDEETLYKLVFSDSEVSRSLFSGNVLTRDKAREFFLTNFSSENDYFGLKTIRLRNTDETIGFAGLISARHLHTKDYEFGFALGKDYWGKGFASEIGQGQINWAFKKLKLNRLFALVRKNNSASTKVLGKLGLHSEGMVKLPGNEERLVYSVYAK